MRGDVLGGAGTWPGGQAWEKVTLLHTAVTDVTVVGKRAKDARRQLAK